MKIVSIQTVHRVKCSVQLVRLEIPQISKMEMPMVKLNVKTNSMQFEDKRIEANAGWNIKELKGKLSELYPTVRS